MEKQEWYRRIPKVDMLLETDGIRQYIPVYGYERVREAVRAELSELRARIAQLPEGEAEGTAEDDVLLNVICEQDTAEPGQSAECENVLTDRIGARLLKMQSPGLKKGVERNRDDPAYEPRQSAPWKGSGVPRAGDSERLLQSGI